MSPAKHTLRLQFASMLASSLFLVGQGAAEEGKNQPLKSNGPERVHVQSQRNTENRVPSQERKPSIAKPSRNQSVRIASTKPPKSQVTSNLQPGESDDAVVQASCKSCAPVRIATNPLEMEYEEPVYSGQHPATSDPEAYRFSNGRSDACGDSCGPCQIAPMSVLGVFLRNMQVRVESATFWGDGQSLQPLVTTRRPASDPATDGLIGRADTTVLFGGREQLSDAEQGIRGEVGLFFDPCQSRGLLFRYFDAGTEADRFNSAGSIDPVVMRPFFSSSPEDNAQSTVAINYPNRTSGSVNVSLESEVYGGDVLFRKLLASDCSGKLEFLAGYQMARLDEQLMISSNSTALALAPVPGAVSQLTDDFSTSNRFHATAFGLNSMMREGCWSLNGMVKLGFGNLERRVNIQGNSQITVPGNPPTTNATTNGLLARSTNEGRYQLDTFVVSPEVALTLGYRFTRNLDVTLSYTYLGIPKVARVGDQLDPQLASNLSNPLTGALTPRFSLAESNFSLHSLSYGLQWQY